MFIYYVHIKWDDERIIEHNIIFSLRICLKSRFGGISDLSKIIKLVIFCMFYTLHFLHFI